MKFTSKKLMEEMGLKEGDKVKCLDEILEVYLIGDIVYLNGKDVPGLYLSYLLDYDYEILSRPKTIGDLSCAAMNCKKCPLNYICGCTAFEEREEHTRWWTLYQILEYFNITDKEIYDLLKARLDKENKE